MKDADDSSGSAEQAKNWMFIVWVGKSAVLEVDLLWEEGQWVWEKRDERGEHLRAQGAFSVFEIKNKKIHGKKNKPT